MSERSNVHAWKACVVRATSGSNPDLCAILYFNISQTAGFEPVFFIDGVPANIYVCGAIIPTSAPFYISIYHKRRDSNPFFFMDGVPANIYVCGVIIPTSAPFYISIYNKRRDSNPFFFMDGVPANIYVCGAIIPTSE